MHPEKYAAKSRAHDDACGYADPHHQPLRTASHHGLGAAAIGKGPELPALEAIGNRIQNMAVRLDDTNRHTGAFVERVSGAEPTKPEAMNGCGTEGNIRPVLDTISMLLDRLDNHVYTADLLSRKLARIA